MRIALFCLSLLATAASADSLTVIHDFSGADGQSPSGLLQASDGRIYGVGANGGDLAACAPDGCGAVFSIGLDGSFTKLHDFHISDGREPTGLVEYRPGTFYGTTRLNGVGGGVIYRIDASGKFKLVKSFGDGSVCCDPSRPTGHLVKAQDGMLYGTSQFGGANRDGADHSLGFGTVYRFDPKTKQVTVIHSFDIADGNGIFPTGPLFLGRDGLLYGTTREGENGDTATVFKIDTAGNFTRVTQLPAMEPLAGVIQTRNGDLYGTNDGGEAGNGSLFRVGANGKLKVFERLDGVMGKGPHFQFTDPHDGFLYSVAEERGFKDPQGGTIFRTDGKDDFRVLHSFDPDVPQGIFPNATLILASDGLMYGTAALGGANGRGTIYRLDPADLGPVQGVSFDPPHVTGGHKSTGTVKLFAPAEHDTVVNLRAQPGPVSVPQSVVVKAGSDQASFKADTFPIGAPNDVSIYVSVDGQGTRGFLKVTP